MQQKKKLRLDKFALLSIAALCAGVFIWWLVTDGLGLSCRPR